MRMVKILEESYVMDRRLNKEMGNKFAKTLQTKVNWEHFQIQTIKNQEYV